MTHCWQKDPSHRPSFRTVLLELNRIYQDVQTHGLSGDGVANGFGALLHPGDLIPGNLDDEHSRETDSLIRPRAPTPMIFDEIESSDWVSAGQGYPPPPPQLLQQHPLHESPQRRTPPLPLQLSFTTPDHSGNSLVSTGGGLNISGTKRTSPLKGVLKNSTASAQHVTVSTNVAPSLSCEPTPRMNVTQSVPGLAAHSQNTSPTESVPSDMEMSIRDASATNLNNSGNSNSMTSSGNYRNELPLNFDVSDLIGPSYYIVDTKSDDDADPLDFLFSDHRPSNKHATSGAGRKGRRPLPAAAGASGGASSGVSSGTVEVASRVSSTPSPPPEVYLGDKPLKPFHSRRRTGSGSGGW